MVWNPRSVSCKSDNELDASLACVTIVPFRVCVSLQIRYASSFRVPFHVGIVMGTVRL